MLRHFRGESTAEALRNTAPQVAEECRQKYIQYQNSLQTVRAIKEQVSQQSAFFFAAAVEPFIRKLAVSIGYLPAPNYPTSITVCEGMKEVRGSDGLIRGTRISGSAQMTKFEALFDPNPAFNAIREDFLVHGDFHSTPEKFLKTMAGMQHMSEPLSAQAELFRGSLASWVQVARVDQSPPPSFFDVAWSAYLQAIQAPVFFPRRRTGSDV